MTVSTDVPVILGSFPDADPPSTRQGEGRRIKPVMLQVSRTTMAWAANQSDDTTLARSEAPQRTYAAPMANALVSREVRADSSPLQVWEGTVIEVNWATGVIQVLLDAKIGHIPRHTGEIELEWVSDQDQDLVRPGAVFYLTLFKRTKPSVENAQELRFRRRPAWSDTQVEKIEREAAMLRSKMKARPVAE
jgi:hypothetical protein